MVDYSRFSKMAAEFDSDDDESSRRPPRVTKFDKPTTVTIGGGAASSSASSTPRLPPPAPPPKAESTNTTDQYAKWAKWAATTSNQEDEEEGSPQRREFIEDEFLPEKAPLPSFSRPAAAAVGSSVLTTNGADNGVFLWSQTADEVTIRVRCALGTKAKQVAVDITKQGLLSVRVGGCSILPATAKLAYGVWDDDLTPFATEEDKFQRSMQWELEDMPDKPSSLHRCVVIRLVKRPPTAGVRVWWRRCFKEGVVEEQEVDVTQIEARNTSQHHAANTRSVWEQAHQEFTSKFNNNNA